ALRGWRCSGTRAGAAVLTVPSRIRMLWFTAYTVMSSGLLFDTLMVMTSGSSGITEGLMHAGAGNSIIIETTTLMRRDTRPATLPDVMRLRRKMAISGGRLS